MRGRGLGVVGCTRAGAQEQVCRARHAQPDPAGIEVGAPEDADQQREVRPIGALHDLSAELPLRGDQLLRVRARFAEYGQRKPPRG